MLSYIKKNRLLLFILSIAFVIRVIGIYPGHPTNHPDEPMSFGSAIEMIIHNDLNPRRFDYPSGVPLLHYLFFQSFLLPIMITKVLVSDPSLIIEFLTNRSAFIQEHNLTIFGYNGVIFLFWSRFLTAFLGTASVFLVYKIGQKLFHPFVGLASAFFLTFNYRHLLSSHLALSDIPNSFFALFSFYACFLLLEKNTLKRYLLAAFAVGLSISIKYQIFALFPFLFVHLLWFLKTRKLSYLFNKNFIISSFLIPLVFCILNPYLILNLKTAIPVIEYVGLRYGMGIQKINYYAIFYLYKWGIGMLPLIFIIFGGIFLTIRNPRKALFLFSYVGIFLYIFLYYSSGGGYVRNFTTVIPFLMIFAGFGFYQLFLLINLVFKKIPYTLIIVLLFIVNVFSIRNSIILAKDYSKPYSRDLLDAWVEKNVPDGANIRNDNIAISSSISRKLNLYNWDHTQENSIEDLSDAQDDFAVLNVAWHQIHLFWSDTPFKELLKYGDIPYRKLKDSYYGISLSEFKNYSVWETYKSWQAPEDSYLVLKIPKFPKDLGRKITEFNFDLDREGWRFYDFSGLNKIEKINWRENDGNKGKGSLEMTGSIPNSEFSRLISPFLKISPEKTYLIEAYVKNGVDLKETARDGFFRIDIFEDSKKELLMNKAINSAVSGRVAGSSSWKKKRVLVKSPKNGKYLTISFQRSSLGAQIPYFLDDIVVLEVNKMPNEPFPNIPYQKPTVPDNVVFPIGVY